MTICIKAKQKEWHHFLDKARKARKLRECGREDYSNWLWILKWGKKEARTCGCLLYTEFNFGVICSFSIDYLYLIDWIRFSFFVYIFIFIEHWPLLRLWTLFSSFEHLDSYSHGWLNTLNLCNHRFILLMWICVKLKVFPELRRTHSPESIFHNTWLNLYFKLC